MFKKPLVEIRHGLQRRINTALRGFCNVLCAACARPSPFAIHGLVLSFKLLGRFLLWLYRFMDTQLIEHGYTWKSPPVILCKTLPFELYMTLRGCFALLRLRLWLGRNNILADVNLGRDYKQMDSLRELGTMNVYEMADILSEYKNLQIEFVEIKPKIIEEVRKEERDFTIDLGNRTIDLRTSLQCMIADFNWLLFVLDLIMSIRIMEMHGISAIGPWSRQYVRSSMRRYCETPSNGLHYKINQATAPRPLSQSDKNIYADSVNRLLQRNPGKHTHPSLNRKLPLFFVPKLNLLDKNTWALDVHFPDFVKANGSFGNIFKAVNHVDPSQRVATPSNDKSIEDYAARGDVQQWYEDLPARIAEQQQLAHPFYRFAR
ncbi:hypothetical protein BKA63DRAFT_257876 [Paraphoma chrysanthemicola]|nr:hypothetical protein BKA63DRAFT_257876 [Paraphoma chrysanthemicola]